MQSLSLVFLIELQYSDIWLFFFSFWYIMLAKVHIHVYVSLPVNRHLSLYVINKLKLSYLFQKKKNNNKIEHLICMKQSNPHFAKICFPSRGQPQRSKGKNQTFSFVMLPDIMASCDKIFLSLTYFFDVKVGLSWGSQYTQWKRNYIVK